MEYKYPVKITVEVMMQGDVATGLAKVRECRLDLPTHEDVLDCIAEAEAMIGDEYSVMSPSEAVACITLEATGQSMAVCGCPSEWTGYTEEELEAARQRTAASEADDQDED